MAPFRHLLHDHRLWSVRRKTIVPAFALGLFIAFMPVPGHFLIAALCALALRINIPVAFITTLVSNPITMGPMYYLCYQVGVSLLDVPARPFAFEMSLAWLGNQFLTIWQPLLLGCFLLGTIAAIGGYVGLDMVWRASIADYLARRRAARAERESGKD